MAILATDFQATHPQFQEKEEEYEMLTDVMAGEYRVKLRRTKYLPMPNASDRSAGNLTRYQQYLTRAVFSNITQRMARTLIGFGFLREPKIELPPQLSVLEDDASGTGLPLVQLAKELALNVIVYGRAGLLVDFPSRTIADPNRLRPYVDLYYATEIINWLVRGRRLQFVTLRRPIPSVEGYNVSETNSWRILEMVGGNRRDFSAGGNYVSKLYNGDSERSTNVVPVDFSRNTFDHITFHICGAFDNSWNIDGAPLAPVASLNLAHYRNSADAEEIAFISGQPQTFIVGLENEVVREQKDKDLVIGSRSGIALGPEGNAIMLQANPNTAARQLMLDKEELMQKLGVQLVASTSTVQTATEVVTGTLISNSVLTTALQNVSLCITKALKDACLYVGANPDDASFEIDTSVELNEEMAANAVSQSVGRGGNVSNSNSEGEAA